MESSSFPPQGLLEAIRHRFLAWQNRSRPEVSRLIIGSTGSGKSEGELVDLVRLAARGDTAIVLLDGHGPLAFRAAGHWGARGHESRMIYEPLDATDRVLCWHMLPRSTATTLARQRMEDADTREEVIQCFVNQRDLDTLNDRPWTREWLEAAIDLCLSQPGPQSLDALLAAFQIGSRKYEQLLQNSDRPEVVGKFRDLERFRRRSRVQYEIQTGASRRLLELVCNSEAARLRSRPGPFDWLAALRQKKLIAFDGGGLCSQELKRTLFLLAGLQVTQAVRRHFAQTRTPLPVVLVLEEAGSLGLVVPFVRSALAELRKAGLAVHLIVQSAADFENPNVFEAILANTPWQIWYQCLSPADQEVGARALANATFRPLAVHYTRTRALPDGLQRVQTYSHGTWLDRRTGATIRSENRSATAPATRYRHIAEASYQTPQLHEQQFRTALASLRIGERIVRDRRRVWRKRVRPLRTPWRQPVFDATTQALIERLRQQPIYQPSAPREPVAVTGNGPDAAARLQGQNGSTPSPDASKGDSSFPPANA